MSQYGMQMPGTQRPRRAAPNIYTGLMLCAVAALATAVVFVGMAAMTVAPADAGLLGVLKLQDPDRIQVAD